MNYKETLSWLFSHIPMFQRVGDPAYKADLVNTKAILSALGNPQNGFKAIHIAGTNGKGSVSHIISSILQEAGYKTGLYTSPHLKDFRERIKINGELISENNVTEFITANKPLFENQKSSFFEMTVGMAFDHFNKENVEIAVIETGMGGRFDSTNLCNPILSIITNIGFDHTKFLGNTLEKIAFEKAGIIKDNIPVIIGKHQSETDNIFLVTANDHKSKLEFAENIVDIRSINANDNTNLSYDIWKGDNNVINNLSSPLSGLYQNENITTALASIFTLNDAGIFYMEEEHIRNGIENSIKNTGFYGRWQTINTNPLVICDAGHNIDGIKSIINQFRDMLYNQLHFVIGMVADKDTFEILNLLPKNGLYYYCKPNIPRGLDEKSLADVAFKAGLNGKTYTSVTQALNSAKNNASVDDLIFVGGSTFVVAEVI
ncbi:MAG: bifunctional folylpolyglutamate synthase/dihydrofolate synthase [Bacteroidales bacterium]|jgi:dihydrofolate synthase/folylpolyglutamate synthase|nr:bifunctional folylpolyglutamate synthase/dihydrofolate synthase [Bacteroidales bacterium]